jgi:hypothetical protein
MTAETLMRYRAKASTAPILIKSKIVMEYKYIKTGRYINNELYSSDESMQAFLFFKLPDIKAELGNGLIQNGRVAAGGV